MRRLIAITPPENIFSEQRRIINMIRSGEYEYVHIRKPSFTRQQLREYLQVFPMDVRQRLSLHQHQDLALELNIKGIHLNKNFTSITDEYKDKRLSASCHSIEEFVQREKECEYCFLSPIFNSLSKQGYASNFDLKELKNLFSQAVLNEKCVALSGITKENIPILEKVGFHSFAMLTDAWTLPKTMFITHQNDKYSYLESALLALDNNIKFIQLRMKDASKEQILDIAQTLRPLCDKHSALMTVDDKIELLESNLFDGVHLGKNDMPINQAKGITMSNYLLGATCNSEQDIRQAIINKADYIGLGPYKYTQTKKKLSPILGNEGYKRILQNVQTSLPIYAIGGITLEDLQILKLTGVYGVAISSLILQSSNPQATIKEILKIF